MLQLSAVNKIYFAHGNVDFRSGIESLSGYCRNTLKHDPMCGAFFVFRNKKGSQLKILCYDGVGFFSLYP
jgi:transposase